MDDLFSAISQNLPPVAQQLVPYLYQCLPILHKAYCITQSILSTTLLPLFHNVYTAQPDITSIVLLILILWLSLRAVRFASRMVYIMTMLIVRFVMILAVVVVGLRLYDRGWDRTMADLESLRGVVEVFGTWIIGMMDDGRDGGKKMRDGQRRRSAKYV